MPRPQLWKVIQQTAANEVLAQWVKDLAKLSFQEVEALPEFAQPLTTGYFRPGYEREVITEDYIAFLNTQIKLKPRGQQWADILARRVEHLRPFVGLQVEFVHLNYYDGNLLETVAFAFNPATKDVIYHD